MGNITILNVPLLVGNYDEAEYSQWIHDDFSLEVRHSWKGPCIMRF
jgi:hypothetical protein